MSEAILEDSKYYRLAALQLLAECGVVQIQLFLNRFEEKYKPRIPEKDQGKRDSGIEIWRHNVGWSLSYLKNNGYASNPERGFWAITDEGCQWLRDNPNAPFLKLNWHNTPGVPKAPKRERMSRPSIRVTQTVQSPSGVTLEMLEQTRQLMPAEQFRQLWGELYDRLLAEDRARRISQVADAELAKRARRELDRVHSFLQGRQADLPDARKICQWIEFCYLLDLYREAAALLQYVNEDEVEPAIYQQAKRFAGASRSRLGW